MPISDKAYEAITRMRVEAPNDIESLWQRRKRRKQLTGDGRLNIIAADHPARRVTEVNGNKLAMANRRDFLSRIVDVLEADAADGVMATIDVLEELLILSEQASRNGGSPFLASKVMIVSLNRGGLAKTVWEMDDPITGPTPTDCREWHVDGAKMLLRIDDGDPLSLNTIRYCAEIANGLYEVDVPLFLEPLPVERTESGVRVKKDAESLAAICGVASALGKSSSGLWLKLPYCQQFELVAQSTTLPILLLGGEAGDSSAFMDQMKEGLRSGSNVRGTMIGRNILYSDRSPAAFAKELHSLVHNTNPPHQKIQPRSTQ